MNENRDLFMRMLVPMNRLQLMFNLVLLIVLFTAGLSAQTDSLDIKSCYDSAYIHYPISRQSQLIYQTYDLKLKNLSSQWFPQISINGQANYNSDVTTLPINLPGIPEFPHDQYKLTIDVNQTLWDGGFRKKQGALDEASRKSDLQQVQVDLYTLRDRINKVYFLALLLEKNEALTSNLVSTLDSKIETAISGVKNGILSPVSVQILTAEKLKAEQKLFEINSDREAALEILGYLTGISVAGRYKLIIPAPSAPENFSNQRPEMELFDLQMGKMDIAQKVASVKNMPRVFAFGQAGYGRPGLNMLSTDWNTFWVVGAGLKWNLWDWHTTQREKQMLAVQKEMLNNQKAGFDLNVKVQASSEMSAVRKYSEAVERDSKLLDLREDILHTVSSQFDNGIVSSSDYVQELNAKIQAEITLQTDSLLLIQARQNLETVEGKTK